MGYIYKITNNINDKLYIGKTTLSLEQRFAQHCKDFQKEDNSNRPLYSAMRKYGIENFSISLIEEFDNNNLSLREQYWIQYYNSYNQGYNATLGGEGTVKFNHEEVITMIINKIPRAEIAKELNCSTDLITDIAKSEGLKNYSAQRLKDSKPLRQLNLQREELRTFNSATEAAQWLLDNNYTSQPIKSFRGKLTQVAKGIRKTAYGFIWEFI